MPPRGEGRSSGSLESGQAVYRERGLGFGGGRSYVRAFGADDVQYLPSIHAVTRVLDINEIN